MNPQESPQSAGEQFSTRLRHDLIRSQALSIIDNIHFAIARSNYDFELFKKKHPVGHSQDSRAIGMGLRSYYEKGILEHVKFLTDQLRAEFPNSEEVNNLVAIVMTVTMGEEHSANASLLTSISDTIEKILLDF